MTVTIVNSPLNALTADGLYQLWRAGFGLSADLPDTAALITEPADLLRINPLGALTMGDVTVDEGSIVDITGAWEVTADDPTGVVTASVTVELSPTSTATPSGAILYNRESQTLSYVTCFASYPPSFDWPLNWAVVINSSVCPA